MCGLWESVSIHVTKITKMLRRYFLSKNKKMSTCICNNRHAIDHRAAADAVFGSDSFVLSHPPVCWMGSEIGWWN